jgi:hypothetical protein
MEQDLEPPPFGGRHELADIDWGKPYDAVTLYGTVTNFVMPMPRRGDAPRHLRREPEAIA